VADSAHVAVGCGFGKFLSGGNFFGFLGVGLAKVAEPPDKFFVFLFFHLEEVLAGGEDVLDGLLGVGLCGGAELGGLGVVVNDFGFEVGDGVGGEGEWFWYVACHAFF
jgi:hypothetical protein